MELALKHSRLNFVDNFKHIVKQIDLFSDNPNLIALSGLDDQLYRMAAFWMFPNLLLTDQARDGHHQSVLNRVKEYVHANINRPITLTELEKLACVSRRTLQNLFLKHTEKSPLQWIRDERLMLAYKMLHQAQPHESVTDIAVRLGFYSSAQFSTLYKQKFGVSPSVHLKRK